MMPRNISFFHSKEQIRSQTKTVTRRLGRQFLKVDDILNACEKCQGLKKGEKITKLGQIRVVSVRRESLETITAEDCAAEGFPEMTPVDFIEFFCKAMSCEPTTIVTRIEFEYVKCAACSHLNMRMNNAWGGDKAHEIYYCFHPHWATRQKGSIGTGSIYLTSDEPPSGQAKCCPWLKGGLF